MLSKEIFRNHKKFHIYNLKFSSKAMDGWGCVYGRKGRATLVALRTEYLTSLSSLIHPDHDD